MKERIPDPVGQKNATIGFDHQFQTIGFIHLDYIPVFIKNLSKAFEARRNRFDIVLQKTILWVDHH